MGKLRLLLGRSGAGRVTCIQMAKLGAKAVVNDPGNELAAESIVTEIVADGGEAAANSADARSREQMEQLVEAVKTPFGRIDVLVCLESLDTKAATFAELIWEPFERQLTDELRAALEPTKTVIQR